MTKDWTFDQPLDDQKPTSSAEERAKIAALFHQEGQQTTEDMDYVAAFEKEQQKTKTPQNSTPEPQKNASQKQPSSTITSDYKQHLADVMVQNHDDIAQSQKKIEELHQLIDEKNKQNKKLQVISAAIDDL